MTDAQITIDTEHLRALFDIAVGSLDFGSGFLDTEEVNHLRAVAVILGVDPLEGTPSEFTSQYPHPVLIYRDSNGVSHPERGCVASWRCAAPDDAPIHQVDGANS